MLLGATLGGVPTARADVGFVREDIALPGAPGSVAIGDLDGRNGKDIAIALPASGSVAVLLNNGDGTFGAPTPYSAGPQCVGRAVEVELGDVIGPAGPFAHDGKLDAYVTCSPYVVRLTGDGAGALVNPTAFQLYLPPYLGSATIDFLALVRRPDGNPAPLLALQHSVGSFGRQLCISDELDSEALVCSLTPVQGPLAVGDLNGAFPDVPPDEIFTALGADTLGIFGFAPQIPTYFTNSVRTVGGGVESAALGDLDRDGRLDVLTGQFINSLNARVDSIRYFVMGASELAQVATPLPSTPGLDAVAIADVNGDGCNDVVGAGGYGRGMIHLANGAGGFDGGRDLPQLGYQNPSTATRVTMAVSDLSGDGRPELVIADALARAVMVYRNASSPVGGACYSAPPPPTQEQVPVVTTPPAVVVPTRATRSRRRWPSAPVQNREARGTSSGRPVTMCSSAAPAATCSAAGAATTACSGSQGTTCSPAGPGRTCSWARAATTGSRLMPGTTRSTPATATTTSRPVPARTSRTAKAATTRSPLVIRLATRSTAAPALTRSPPTAPTSSRTAST